MKCFRCGKEMDREHSLATIKGIEVNVEIELDPIISSDIDYYNKQLGKYSNGKGECHVGLCYECYIDGLFQRGGDLQVERRRNE